MDRWTIGALLDTTTEYLRERNSDSPRLDAELLLAEALGLERIDLYTGYDRPVSSSELDLYRALVRRRAQHEPVAYILGHAYFRRLSLEVSRAVLIPRPETEELVGAALELLRLRPVWETCAESADSVSPASIADVGTGSGAIALSIAQETGMRVLAMDASPDALQVAGRNRKALGLEELVELGTGDLLTGVEDGSLALVVSNPPYVRSGDMEALAPDVRLFEPVSALDAGEDGLAVICRLLPQAARALRPGGSVLLEVGDGQAETVTGLAREAGFATATVRKDLSGKERIVTAILPGATVAPLGGLDGRQRVALRDALAKGAAIGAPTDTVYGIAARWDSQSGVDRLSLAKGRGSDRPLAVLFPSVEAIARALPDVDAPSLRVLRALLPGPYTFVVGTAVARPPLVGTTDSLGVRVPDFPPLLEFLASLETPLAATSANLSGGAEAGVLSDVDPLVLAHCSIAFSDAPRRVRGEPATASSVVDLRPLASGALPLVLREGQVKGTAILERIRGAL